MKERFLFLISVSFLLSACSKDEVQPNSSGGGYGYTLPEFNYISYSIQPYKFLQGTYWIYENDSTGALDSIVVDSARSGSFESTPSVHGSTGSTFTETYTMYLQNYTSPEQFDVTLMTNYIYRNYSGDWSNFQGQPVFGSEPGTSKDGMTVLPIYPTYTVGGATYSLVKKMQIIAADQSLPEFSNDTYLYYSDSVGLIKKETQLSTTNIESWSLKRCNILR